MVVCESVPTKVSASQIPFSWRETLAKNSKLTWCTIPLEGGTAWKSFSDFCPHFRNVYRSILR